MGKKEDPYAAFLAAISPMLNQQKQISADLAAGGKEDFGVARGQYNNLISYFQNFLHGDRDTLLQNEDVSGITQSYDDAERMLGQFGTRGGRSAEKMGNIGFDRAGEINRFIQVLRKEAPDKLFQLAQAMAQLGSNEYSISSGAANSFLGAQFNLQSMRDAKYENEKARKSALIRSIIGAAGGVAGALIGGLGGGGGGGGTPPIVAPTGYNFNQFAGPSVLSMGR